MKTTNSYFAFTFLISLIFGIGSEYLHAQIADTTGVSDGLPGATRVLRLDTRSVSMAGATMADPYSNSSMNNNPALISFVEQPLEVEYHIYQNWNNNLFQQNLTLPAIRIGNHTAVVQMNYSSSGNYFNNPIGEPTQPVPNLILYDVAMAYSYSINNVVSLGIMNNFTFATNDDVQYLTYFADLGLLYKPAEHLSYGLVFRGLGSSVTYQTYGNNRFTRLDTHNLRERLEIGATLYFPAESDDPWMSVSFSNEKLFGIRGIWYKGGLELKPTSYLAFRSGLLFVPNERFVAPRYGIGLDTDYLRLDYSISPKQVFSERFHQISLTLQF